LPGNLVRGQRDVPTASAGVGISSTPEPADLRLPGQCRA
jgi:hypothetical protein